MAIHASGASPYLQTGPCRGVVLRKTRRRVVPESRGGHNHVWRKFLIPVVDFAFMLDSAFWIIFSPSGGGR